MSEAEESIDREDDGLWTPERIRQHEENKRLIATKAAPPVVEEVTCVKCGRVRGDEVDQLAPCDVDRYCVFPTATQESLGDKIEGAIKQWRVIVDGTVSDEDAEDLMFRVLAIVGATATPATELVKQRNEALDQCTELHERLARYEEVLRSGKIMKTRAGTEEEVPCWCNTILYCNSEPFCVAAREVIAEQNKEDLVR